MKGSTARYRVGDLIIDTGARRVTRDAVDLGITGLTFELLLAMGRAAPNLLSVDALLRTVWPDQEVGPETLTQRIKLLRRQLGDSAKGPRYIASRRGHGYRLLTAMVPLPPIGHSSVNARATQLYVQSRAVVRGTHASRDEAIEFLTEALRLDPQFAAARAYRAFLQAGSVSLSGASRSLLAAAEQDAVEALAIDPDLSDAHLVRGWVCAEENRWPDAENHFGRAREHDPTGFFAGNIYALAVLRPTGRVRYARAQLIETSHRVPTDGFTLHELVLTHALLGEDSEALAAARVGRAVTGIATPVWDVSLAFARAEAREGRFASAADHAIDALSPALQHQGGSDAVRAFYAALDHPAQRSIATATLRGFAPRLRHLGVDCRTRAFFVTALATLGAIDAAYDLIEDLLFAPSSERCSVELSDLWLPEMNAFRAHRRFDGLVHRLGLPQYWAQYGFPDIATRSGSL